MSESSLDSSPDQVFRGRLSTLYGALALSYDLVVGHVGSLSLAHPAFFGIGAYTAALLATEARWPFAAPASGRRATRVRRGTPTPWWTSSRACTTSIPGSS